MSPSAEDRRKYLRAYGYNRICRIRLGVETFTASLVDISRGGMRLAFSQNNCHKPSFDNGASVHISVTGLPNDKGLSSIVSNIRWRDGSQFGVQFQSPLPHGTAELQQLIAFEEDERPYLLKPKNQ